MKNPALFLVALASGGLLGAVRVEQRVEQFAFPDLHASLKMVMLQKHTAGALLSPTKEGFRTRATGRFAYTLRELTGHSWTCPVGDGVFSAALRPDGALAVSNDLVFASDRATDTLCWRYCRNFRRLAR